MAKRVAVWNSGDKWNDPDLVWGPLPPGEGTLLTSDTTLAINTAMEYWEITKARAIETLPVWTTHLPDLEIGSSGPAALETLIDGFEPLATARTVAQDDYDAAFRAAQDALLRMKVLGTKIPALIEGHLDENKPIMKDLDDLYAVYPRGEDSILKRMRMLLPVWVRANAALAALTPAHAPITRAVGGVNYTVAAAQALFTNYTELLKAAKQKQDGLDDSREALRAHDRTCDQLNKRFYKIAKATADADSPLAHALEGITTEPGMPAPETVEIATVTQGGEGGLQALLSFVPGGGDHATTKVVKWKVEGVDADFTHSVPLDASGNALGPFAVGQVVTMITEVSNSVATRTTAPRTITIQTPVV